MMAPHCPRAALEIRMGDTELVARVPCASGARLHFSWGPGMELRFMEVQHPDSKEGGEEPCKSTVIWYVL